MPLLFPSMEWAQGLVGLINDTPEFGNNIELDNAAITFNIQFEEGSLEDNFIVWLKVSNGKIQEFKKLSSPREMDSMFQLGAK
jgi:hypothetical protein